MLEVLRQAGQFGGEERVGRAAVVEGPAVHKGASLRLRFDRGLRFRAFGGGRAGPYRGVQGVEVYSRRQRYRSSSQGYCYTPTFLDFGWARGQSVFKLVLANYDASVGTQAFSGRFRRTGIDCDDDIHVAVVVRYAAYGSQLDRGTVFHLIIICVRI